MSEGDEVMGREFGVLLSCYLWCYWGILVSNSMKHVLKSSLLHVFKIFFNKYFSSKKNHTALVNQV